MLLLVAFVRGKPPNQHGFTLIELMITVAIVGILAALATWGVSRYVRLSKSSEATHMIGAFKAAQETYKSDMFSYLDVAGENGAISAASYYPAKKPAKVARSWLEVSGSESPVGLRVKQLGVVADAPVWFVYACAAGSGTQAPAGPQLNDAVENWPAQATGQPWYVVSARGDLNGDGVESRLTSASFTTQIFTENEGE
jgi:prepilin-type N-terminal cleavage/methylation domain-containing protein